MEEIRDQMELANEISDVISQPVGLGVEMDEVCLPPNWCAARQWLFAVSCSFL
jgi:hypothetical protein